MGNTKLSDSVDPITVWCPVCHALPGKRCTIIPSKDVVINPPTTHRERRVLATQKVEGLRRAWREARSREKPQRRKPEPVTIPTMAGKTPPEPKPKPRLRAVKSDPFSVRCPKCGADKYEWCQNKKGDMDVFHFERKREARLGDHS